MFDATTTLNEIMSWISENDQKNNKHSRDVLTSCYTINFQQPQRSIVCKNTYQCLVLDLKNLLIVGSNSNLT